MGESCVFCEIVAGDAPATVLASWPDALAIRPLGPVTPGHALIIPRRHVRDLTEDPEVTAATFRRAAEYAQPPVNLITSAGEVATQSVYHLHVHVLPRSWRDGVRLPWHSGKHARPTSSGSDQEAGR